MVLLANSGQESLVLDRGYSSRDLIMRRVGFARGLFVSNDGYLHKPTPTDPQLMLENFLLF